MSQVNEPKSQNENLKLPNEVAEKYEVVGGINMSKWNFRGRTIDFNTISLEEAEKLAKSKNFPWFREKKSSQPAVR